MVQHVSALQELEALMDIERMAGPEGCCALGSVGTCPSNTFDSIFCQAPDRG